MKRLPIIGIGVGLVIGLLVLGSLYEPIPAHGATSSGTILVTTSSDTLANDGLCSLREAITAANTDTASRPAAGECAAGSGDDTILLPSGTFTLVRAGANEDSNLTGDLDLLSNVVLSGAGQGLTTLDGNQLDRVLHVHAGASVTVAQLAVQGGRAPDGADASYPVDGQPGSPGGGILSEGTLVIQYSTIRDSRAGDGGDGQGVGCMYWTDGGTGGDGGGIYAAGPLVLDGAVVTSNEAGNGGNTQRDLHEGPRGGHGGGIVAVDTLSVTDATISANVAGTGGHGCVGPGGVGGDGGGLWVSGTAHLGHSLVEANHAGQGQVGFQGGAGGSAGGLFQQGGTLTLTESAVRDNHAGEGGDGDGVDGGTGGHAGGLFVATSASASLEGTLFDSNHAGNGGYSDYTFPEPECDFYACGAGGNGGALAVEGVLMLARSTISGNRAGDGGYLAGTGTLSVGGDGGGLWIADNTSVQVADTTLTLNEAGLGGHDSGTPPQQGDPGRGGGFFGESELTNTIVAANLMNETDPSDCYGTLESGGYNLLETSTDCTISGTITGNQIGVDPVLGALADNGGATETHGLLAGSPARDAGQCASGVDQRGFPRPIDLSEPNVANGCDIGAFEVQVAHVAPTTVHVVEGGDTESYTVTLLAEPRASVTITIVPDDQTTVSPQVLTFTSATWNQPQSVTVSAVDDGIYEGAHTGTITHTASSADPRFQGDVVPDVLAIIADRANHLYLPVIAK